MEERHAKGPLTLGKTIEKNEALAIQENEALCSECGHIGKDHQGEGGCTQCWSGSLHSGKCGCTEFIAPASLVW